MIEIKLGAGASAANTFVATSAALSYMQANGGPGQAVLAAYPPVTSDTRCSDATYTKGGTDYTTGAGKKIKRLACRINWVPLVLQSATERRTRIMGA